VFVFKLESFWISDMGFRLLTFVATFSTSTSIYASIRIENLAHART
jgi:hypothetical protein